ncbi:MAG: hypothetical protein ACOCYC_03080 [bacterium]
MIVAVPAVAVVLGGCAFSGADLDDAADYSSGGDETENNIFLGTANIDFEIDVDDVDVDGGPAFSWNDNERPYVLLAIFNDDLDIGDNRILNEEVVVWTWHSGLGKGLRGDIDYEDGVAVVDGELQEYTDDLDPLADGSYQAGLWMYDQNYNLTESSVLKSFTIGG